MKQLILAGAVGVLLSTAALAAQDDARGNQGQAMHGNQGQMMHGNGMMGGMMNQQQMEQVQEHFKVMQELMADAQKEHDPARRMAMMNEHLQQMNQMMGMMGGGMMGGMMGKGMMGGSNQSGTGQGNMTMEQRLEMMQQRMGMMQGLMGQMMQHMTVEHEDEDKAH